MSILKSVTTNTLYQIISKGIAIITGLVITRILTQTLSQPEYGIYTLITSLIILITTITDWGTGFIAVRAASQSLFPAPRLYANLIYLRVITGFIGTLTTLSLAALNLLSIPSSVYVIAAFIIIPLNLRNVAQSVFQATLTFKYHAISEAISNLLFLCFILYISQHPPVTVNGAIIALVLSSILALLLSFRLSLFTTSYSFKFDIRILKYLIRESIPLGAQLLIFSIYNRLDTYILQSYQGQSIVALYGLSYKIYGHLVMGAAFLMNSLYPHLSQTLPGHQLQRLYQRIYGFLLFSGLAIGITTYLTAPFIISLINSRYHESIFALQLLSFALPFAYLNHLTGYTLISQNRQWLVFFTSLASLAVNAILNIIFIPHYSLYGAAIITAITEASMTILTTIIIAHYIRLHPVKNLFTNNKFPLHPEDQTPV